MDCFNLARNKDQFAGPCDDANELSGSMKCCEDFH